MKTPKSLFLAAIFLIFSSILAQAGCVQPYRFCAGCATDISMTLVSGKTCTMWMAARGGIAGMETIKAPSHGRFGKENETSAAYMSERGYTGADDFESRLYYELPGGKKTFTLLRVHVNVLAK